MRRITDKTDERTGESSNVFLKQRFESGSQWEIWVFFLEPFFVGEREGKERAGEEEEEAALQGCFLGVSEAGKYRERSNQYNLLFL